MEIKIEEIKEDLNNKLELSIKDCLDELTNRQQAPEWYYLRPYIHRFNQDYLDFLHFRYTRYWSFRQKQTRYELLKIDLQFFISNLVVFVPPPGSKFEIKYNFIRVNGDNSTILQDNKDAQIAKTK